MPFVSPDVVPPDNIAIFKQLYSIEVGLREFIIVQIESKDGKRGWKTRLPADLLNAFRNAITYERAIKWTNLVPHHPIYYLDFPDLKKVIQRSDNWNDIFRPVFENKEVVLSTLSELEPIRNKIAHNRKATKADVKIVDGAYEKISSAIGATEFVKFISRCTRADDIPDFILRLLDDARLGFKSCNRCDLLPELKVWNLVKDSWWFDKDYLCHEVSETLAYFDSLLEYRHLPRVRGSGHIIKAWVSSSKLQEKYDSAMQELSSLLKQSKGA
jgi:Swt1-like HEPN